MDPPSAKAKPISHGGITAGITDFRGEKLKEYSKICERSSPADTQISEEGEAGCAAGAGAEDPLQPVVETLVSLDVPLQPTEFSRSRDPPAAHGGPHTGGGCAFTRSLCWCRFLWAHREMSPHWSTVTVRTGDRTGTHWSSLLLEGCTLQGTHGRAMCELQPVVRTHTGEINGGLSPVGAGKGSPPP
ncbi:hypothetical protein HGM15179_013794 [Zosterops borbonicus]|uniref:Uncharacterized protein n=1 Tax=Zosterops borbonicus TaxID=364589 RepID=A0A8K1G7D5_9PASS|nr:hypothetical protein HGM15179_013794 [Zosterops borbonicus]